jgi:hypothetical protein
MIVKTSGLMKTSGPYLTGRLPMKVPFIRRMTG